MTANTTGEEVALTYDDVLLTPQSSPVDSRADVDTSSTLAGDVTLDVPVVSASMDTITGPELATELARAGGIGFLPRFQRINEQVEDVRDVDGPVVGCVGINNPNNNNAVRNAQKLVENGAVAICMDVAHGQLEKAVESVRRFDAALDVPLIAGNVATGMGGIELESAGADAVKVGIGPGSHCETREVTGVGVPQFTAVKNVVEAVSDSTAVIADGGIRTSGDASKALIGAGADTVMLGGLFGKCREAAAPLVSTKEGDYHKTRGMASEEARADASDLNVGDQQAIEGSSAYTEVETTVSEFVSSFDKGIRSSCSYCGGASLQEARKYAQWKRVTPNSVPRAGVHGSANESL